MACSRDVAKAPSELGFTAAELPAARARGRAIFLRTCALCHGEDADGNGPRAAGFEKKPADLNGPDYQGQAERVLRAVRDGVQGTPMASWKGSLADSELREVTAYVIHLKEDQDVRKLRMR